MGWGEGSLLGLSMEIVWVSVEAELTDLDQRHFTLWPDLGDIVGIKSVLLSLVEWHSLDIEGP